MPAPIIDALITYLVAETNCTIWDGEVPRFDTSGLPINQNSVTNNSPPVPNDWPVVRVLMTEGGFNRTWTTEDPYDDVGEIKIEIYGQTRVQCETLLNTFEAILAQGTNWLTGISPLLGGPSVNPYAIVQMLLENWFSVQKEGERTSQGELLYMAGMTYTVMIHGAISTFRSQAMQVGDAVAYIPHEIHATKKDYRGNRPWTFGLKKQKMVNGKLEEVIEVLNSKDEEAFFSFLARSNNPEEQKKKLVCITPKAPWHAVVTAVNPDGTANLDVESPNTGFTLHENNIRVALTTEPWASHTCIELPQKIYPS